MMNIRFVAGDIAGDILEEMDAAVLWYPVFITRGPWEQIREKCPDLIALEGDAPVDSPSLSEENSLWIVSPPLGQLCYLLVISNPKEKFGCFGLEEVQKVLTSCLDRLSRLEVRCVTMHLPVFEPGPLGESHLDYQKYVEGMTTILRNWEKSNPGKIEQILLVDKTFHFPAPLQLTHPLAWNEGEDAGLIPPQDDNEREFLLSVHGSWMLENSIESHAEKSKVWKATAIKAATKLRAWAKEGNPVYLSSTIQAMDALLLEENPPATEAENSTCSVGQVKSCTRGKLKGGNDSELAFPLSLDGAWLLLAGIQNYAQDTRTCYAVDFEDAGYCSLRAHTALKEAEKLRRWANEVQTNEGILLQQAVARLVQTLVSDTDRFRTLAVQESRLKGEIQDN